MKLYDLSTANSLLNVFVSEIRDKTIQKDPIRFRKNLERIGEIMAYEISKEIAYELTDIETPLSNAKGQILQDTLVLGTILRAGLPFHQGMLNYFDRAENAFVSAYRKYKDKLNFDIHIEYISSPDISGKTLILSDPMLATGSSLELAYKAILTKGEPKTVHMACIIASQQGIDYIRENINDAKVTLWCAAIDPDLNDKSYIVPGLGDAGDLAFGGKI